MIKLICKVLIGRSIRAILIYRISSWLYIRGLKVPAFFFWSLNVMLHAIEISPKARLGKGLRIPHTVGIVIGEGVVAGENLSIYQNVTIGSKGDRKEGKNTYPKIGNNVTIFPGAVVVGDINIGDNAIIGANAVVIRDVPNDYSAMGVPAILKQNKDN